MKILIANPGSTSYKCKFYNAENMEILFQAVVEKIGQSDAIFRYAFKGEKETKNNLEIKDYYSAVDMTLSALNEKYSTSDIAAVGFKTVHAKGISGCVELTDEVIDAMKEYRPLAPVHTDVYLTAISIFKDLLKTVPLVGLFETHFHSNIPPEAFMYGIPYEYYEKHGIRKYGFHGASHRYIALRAKELYDANKVISCHLGGSSSVCAIKNGVSIDTSMGMSPQCGLINAKRVGDLDSYALLYLMQKEKLSIDDAIEILMTKGGLYGISGIKSGDLRDIELEMEKGNYRAKLAFDTFVYNVKRYIGEYMAILNGADCIVFTAGGGQNSILLRRKITENMENLGVLLDEQKNEMNPKEGLISSNNSSVKIAIIPTNEEFIVASEVKKFLDNKN